MYHGQESVNEVIIVQSENQTLNTNIKPMSMDPTKLIMTLAQGEEWCKGVCGWMGHAY
jgi:hypothetical protein